MQNPLLSSCDRQLTLKSDECIALCVTSLQSSLDLSLHPSCSYSAETVYHSLLGMSSRCASIHSLPSLLANVPSETTIRRYLKKLSMTELVRKNTAILTHHTKDLLVPGQSYEFAIDITNDPYYGEIDETNQINVISGQTKKSTHTFYAYISLYIITKNTRLTLAVYPVQKGVSQLDYVKQCVQTIHDLGIGIIVLCLDRGFYSIALFSFLQQEEIPYIVPVKKQGNDLKMLLQGRKYRWETYEMHNAEQSLEVDILIDVKYIKGRKVRGMKKSHGCQNLGYIVYGVKNWKPRKISNTYKRRFAIESSYRMRNQVKCRTSSKNATLRYFYMIIALMLKNIWVVLQARYFAQQRRGPRVIEEKRFRFQMFMGFIWAEVVSIFKPVLEVKVIRIWRRK